MAKLSAGPSSLLCPGSGSVAALWAVQVGAGGGGPAGLPSWPEINHQVREAGAFCAGETRWAHSPSLQAMSKHAAGPCFFSRFKNIQWTCVYSSAKGCDAEQESTPPSPSNPPPEEPPCLHRGSLRPRPQALETLCSGLQLRESRQGKCLSFRSQTVSCIVQTHSVNNDLTLGSEPRLSGPLSPGFSRRVWRENRRGIGFPHPDPVFLLLWDYG